MKTAYLKRSDKRDKKYMVVLDDGSGRMKTIHFGARGMSDYTKHKDSSRKSRYSKRHSKNENWGNWRSAGFWSKNILWNKPTISESVRSTEKRYGIKIVRGSAPKGGRSHKSRSRSRRSHRSHSRSRRSRSRRSRSRRSRSRRSRSRRSRR